MKKVVWMIVTGMMLTATYSYSQGYRKEGGKKNVPRDVRVAERMKQDLNLSEEQYEKVLELNKELELEREKNKDRMNELRKQRVGQLQEILTEEQWKLWNEREHKPRPGRHEGPGKRKPENDE